MGGNSTGSTQTLLLIMRLNNLCPGPTGANKSHLVEAVVELSTKYTQSLAHIDTLKAKSQCEQQESANGHLKSRVCALESEVEALQTQRTNLSEEVQQLREALVRRENTIEALHKQLASERQTTDSPCEHEDSGLGSAPQSAHTLAENEPSVSSQSVEPEEKSESCVQVKFPELEELCAGAIEVLEKTEKQTNHLDLRKCELEKSVEESIEMIENLLAKVSELQSEKTELKKEEKSLLKERRQHITELLTKTRQLMDQNEELKQTFSVKSNFLDKQNSEMLRLKTLAMELHSIRRNETIQRLQQQQEQRSEEQGFPELPDELSASAQGDLTEEQLLHGTPHTLIHVFSLVSPSDDYEPGQSQSTDSSTEDSCFRPTECGFCRFHQSSVQVKVQMQTNMELQQLYAGVMEVLEKAEHKKKLLLLSICELEKIDQESKEMIKSLLANISELQSDNVELKEKEKSLLKEHTEHVSELVTKIRQLTNQNDKLKQMISIKDEFINKQKSEIFLLRQLAMEMESIKVDEKVLTLQQQREQRLKKPRFLHKFIDSAPMNQPEDQQNVSNSSEQNQEEGDPDEVEEDEGQMKWRRLNIQKKWRRMKVQMKWRR
ncbi:hypothetical protein WMY93_024630 [Mugilogobius chulae]|uniref:Uncharacterized protein n=1 Tax=Mugilogobius chulae TaxID=88201 RepID=A0AAW0NAJ9_9GOBI